MKQSTTFALGLFLAMVAAMPLEKRDEYTTTVIEDVTDIVDVYTTVWVSPGDPRLTQNQQAVAPTQPSSASAVTTSSAAAYTPPQTTSSAAAIVPQKQEEAAVKAPTSTPTPSPSVTPSVTPQPKVEAVAPVQTSASPVSSSSPSSGSPSSSGPSGGSCAAGGQCSAANVTTFDGSTGAGACGWVDNLYDADYFALASDTMGEQSNGNPLCNKKAVIVYNGQNFPATLADKCPSTSTSCGGESLDLSPTLFSKIFGTDTGNFHDIEWYFTDI